MICSCFYPKVNQDIQTESIIKRFIYFLLKRGIGVNVKYSNAVRSKGKRGVAFFSLKAKTVFIAVLLALVLILAIGSVVSLPVTHLGSEIITPVPEALHSADSTSLGGVAQTSTWWLANTQRPITTPCPTGQSIQKVNPDGTVVCQSSPSYWTASGSNIFNNNPGQVLIGGSGTLRVGTICLGGVCKNSW